MYNSKETKILNTICVVLVLLTGVVRIIRDNYRNNIIIFILFIIPVFIWLSQLRKRIIQPEERKYLLAVGYMIVFVIILRTIKFDFLPHLHFTVRYAWYMYYIPQTFIPLWIFFAVLHIWKPHNQPINRRWKLLYIPAFLIVIGILTNDLHQLAFRFPEGISDWKDETYFYGVFYYAAILWMFILFGAILVIAFIRCSVSANRKNIWIPIIPLAVGALYIFTYLLFPKVRIIQLFKAAEMICFVFPTFIECLILAHLSPSNDSYGALWNSSNLRGGIMDSDGVIRYRSEKCIPVTAEQVRESEKKDVFIDSGNTLLKSHAIHGGYGYWTRDISEVRRLNSELKKLGDVLSEENAILEEENRLEEKRVKIEQQNKLYGDIALSVRPQLEKLSEMLDNPPEEEPAFEQTMKFASVVNAYVKRHSNMLLLLHQNKRIYSDELSLAVSESLEYLRLCGIFAHGEYSGEELLAGGNIIFAYELFEAVLEAGIPGIDAVLVNLNIDSGISLHMEISSPLKLLPQDYRSDEISALNGKLTVKTDGQTEYVFLTLPTGGDSL